MEETMAWYEARRLIQAKLAVQTLLADDLFRENAMPSHTLWIGF